MKTIKLFLAVIALSLTTVIDAQKDKDKSVVRASSVESSSSYTTGLGLRIGLESGITFKHFFKPNHAGEFLLSRAWSYGGFRFTALYEYQKAFPDIQGFNWFVGGGIHIGSYPGRYYGYGNRYGYGYGYYDKHGKWHNTGYKDNYAAIGLDLILGLEYQFADYPITVGLDVKPFFDFYGANDHYVDGALTVRYILK